MVCALYLIEKKNKTLNLVITLNVGRAHPCTPSIPHTVCTFVLLVK